MILAAEAFRPLRRALAWSFVAFVVNGAGVWLLDAAGVADRILSASPSAIVLVPFLLAILIARLALYFLMPGLILRGLVLGLLARRG
ncbi:Hypothetical protein A7982_02864 [Minicystis rosea]|nr:Hypothetical protein A7982_02864 [Minicystis rosea]